MRRKIKDFVGPWKAGEKMYLTYRLMKHDRKMLVTKKMKNNFIEQRLLKIRSHEESKRYDSLEMKNFIAMLFVVLLFLTPAAVIFYKTKLASIAGDKIALETLRLISKTMDTFYTVIIFVLFAVGIVTMVCMITNSVKGKHDISRRYAIPSKNAICLSIGILITEIFFLQ